MRRQLLFTVAAVFFGSLSFQAQPASDCSDRDPAEIASFSSAARDAPVSFVAQVELALCYDQAWRFAEAVAALGNAIKVLDHEIAVAAPGVAQPAVAALGGRPVAGTDVPAPKRIRGSSPDYPRDALARGITGLVILEVVIDAGGAVIGAKAAKSHPALDEAAINAARKWKYEPTIVAGKPTEVLGYAPVRFGLSAEPIASDWIEIALFHYRSGERRRASTALTAALTKALEDKERWSGFADLSDKGDREGVTLPTVKKQVDPVYPRRALLSETRDGKVRLEGLVDREGKIGRVRILGKPSLFDAASLQAALQWTFKPALKLGTPIPCLVQMEMEFLSR